MNAKAMAKTLESALAARKIDLPHSAALEIVAEQFGFRDWNVLSARINADSRTDDGTVAIQPAIPVLRTFTEDKAREFYEGWLGSTPRVTRNMRLGIEKQDWGLEMTVIDSFGNRIRFCEQRHV